MQQAPNSKRPLHLLAEMKYFDSCSTNFEAYSKALESESNHVKRSATTERGRQQHHGVSPQG